MSAGHSHGTGEVEDPTPGRARRVVAVVAAVIAALAVVLVVVTWPDEAAEDVGYQPFAATLFDAEITAAEEVPCQGVPVEDQPEIETTCLVLELTLQEGPDEGETATLNYNEVPGSTALEVGDQIVAGYSPEAAPEFRYYFADFQRETPLLLLFVLFAVAVLLLGRFGGFRALLGAAASLVVIVQYLIPALLAGTTPVLAAGGGRAGGRPGPLPDPRGEQPHQRGLSRHRGQPRAHRVAGCRVRRRHQPDRPG